MKVKLTVAVLAGLLESVAVMTRGVLVTDVETPLRSPLVLKEIPSGMKLDVVQVTLPVPLEVDSCIE
jgi:hypothetical protein